jgi:hypothetical protein
MAGRVIFSPRVFRMAARVPDITLLNGVVAPEVLDAMRSASTQLARAGIRHALVGHTPEMLEKFDALANEALS